MKLEDFISVWQLFNWYIFCYVGEPFGGIPFMLSLTPTISVTVTAVNCLGQRAEQVHSLSCNYTLTFYRALNFVI